MKKLISILMAAMLCLSLAACGGEKAPAQSGGSSSGNEGGSAAAPASSDPVNLTVAYADPEDSYSVRVPRPSRKRWRSSLAAISPAPCIPMVPWALFPRWRP